MIPRASHVSAADGPQRAGRAEGVILLEVVLALTLFFTGSLVVLAGLNASLRTAQRVQLEAQASDLAVTLVSEIQMGLYDPVDDGPYEYEEEALAGWTWEIDSEPFEEISYEIELPEFFHVEIIIRYEPSNYVYRLTQLLPAEEEVLEEPVDEFGGGQMQMGPGGR